MPDGLLMGLPTLTIDAELAQKWRSSLEQYGIWIDIESSEVVSIQRRQSTERAFEVYWRIKDERCDILIIEVRYLDRNDNNTYLI